MKRLFLLAFACLIATTATSQTDTVKTKAKEKPSCYLSLGLATSGGNNLKASTYVGLESGIMYKNISLSAMFGRGSLLGMGRHTDASNNYFYEIKTCGYIHVHENLTANVTFGWGGYINSSHNFIEYGIGMVYNIGKIGYGVSYSNWDGTNYVAPSITLNF